MDVLVAYDIGDTKGKGAKRLRAISDLCCEYGYRVQLSVFECRLTPAGYASLQYELHNIIDVDKDCVHLYRFPQPISEWKTVIGTSCEREVDDTWII